MRPNLVDFALSAGPGTVCAFGGPKMPAPQPLPTAPSEDPEAVKQRDIAAREAQVAQAAGGRRSTIFAGGLDESEGGAELLGTKKRRTAAADLGMA